MYYNLDNYKLATPPENKIQTINVFCCICGEFIKEIEDVGLNYKLAKNEMCNKCKKQNNEKTI